MRHSAVDALGVSRPAFAGLLNERAVPLPEMAFHIVKAFGVRMAPERVAWLQDRPGLR
jgi:plasmid maintenance system antidote protein VapI